MQPRHIAIRFEGVTCRFDTRRTSVIALDGVTLDVRRGEFVSIVGPSGCGKSTLLKVAAGLVRPSQGRTTFLGSPVDRPQHNIGYVFQRPSLLAWRNVRQNILLQAEMRNMNRAMANRRADQLIEMVGLRGFERALPCELSGGMQQRVALCRALLHEPPVLLMDEPFAALDALTREQLGVELNRIWRETQTTVLFVTHSITEAVYLSGRVAVMSYRPGRILECLDVPFPATRDYEHIVDSRPYAALSRAIRGLLQTTGHPAAHDHSALGDSRCPARGNSRLFEPRRSAELCLGSRPA